jgi:hypothetical protein
MGNYLQFIFSLSYSCLQDNKSNDESKCGILGLLRNHHGQFCLYDGLTPYLKAIYAEYKRQYGFINAFVRAIFKSSSTLCYLRHTTMLSNTNSYFGFDLQLNENFLTLCFLSHTPL